MSNILTWRKPNQIHKQYGGTDETYTECDVGYTSIRHGLFYHPFPPVRAGLMRIRFEFEQDPTYGGESRSTGLGFLQFDEIEEDVWVPISDLTNLSYFLSVTVLLDSAYVWIDQSPSNIADRKGEIFLSQVAPEVFEVSGRPSTDWLYDGWRSDASSWEISVFLMRITHTLTPMAGDWYADSLPYRLGTFTTSVRFDDPPRALTIPPSALLMVSALLPILGVKKWRRS